MKKQKELTLGKQPLGQLVDYMQDLDLQYGFMGTYNRTIFLRQVYSDGEWRLQYSPAIRHSTDTVRRTEIPQPWEHCVSLRECMFFLSQLAIAGHRVVNDSVPWVLC